MEDPHSYPIYRSTGRFDEIWSKAEMARAKKWLLVRGQCLLARHPCICPKVAPPPPGSFSPGYLGLTISLVGQQLDTWPQGRPKEDEAMTWGHHISGLTLGLVQILPGAPGCPDTIHLL